MRVLVFAIAVAVGCGGDSGVADDAAPGSDADQADAADPPTPAGCIDDVSAGDHTFSCDGLQVDARIPAACRSPGCGLILVLHGDTGNGLLMDGHVRMRDLGEENGYVVIAPTGPPFGGGFPGSTWNSSHDATLVGIAGQFRDVFRIDPRRIHVTGFSRGAFVTWRLLCDHSDFFASAAPAGAGRGTAFGETTCFEPGRTPTRPIPIIFLMGRTDVSVGYQSMVTIRDEAITAYGGVGPTTVDGDADFTHDRWTGPGGEIIETFDHAYETVDDGPFASARGHCIAGSTTDPYAPQYAIPCELPNAFVWGEEVMRFFQAHPLP